VHWRNYYPEVINSGMSVDKFNILLGASCKARSLAAPDDSQGRGPGARPYQSGRPISGPPLPASRTVADIVTAAPDASAKAVPDIDMQGTIRFAAGSFMLFVAHSPNHPEHRRRAQIRPLIHVRC
jgi:hypothetical protein